MLATAGLESEGLSCRDGVTSSARYEVNGVDRGAVACWIDEGIITFTPTIEWTDTELLVLGRATFEVATGFRGNAPDLSLYEWWSEEAGPTDTGLVSPKADPIEVPEGMFSLTITEDEVGPLNEGGADPRWVGVWQITFDGEIFREQLVGSYTEESGLFWGKGDRLVLSRDYNFPPLGGVTTECERFESLDWELDGDTLVFSRPSPEQPCQAFRDLAVFKPWTRV